MNYSLFELISYFGGLLGLILFFVTLITSKAQKTIKYSLAALLFVGSLIIFLGALNYSGKIVYSIHLLRLDSPLHYLLGPAVYFYTCVKLKPGFQFRKIHLLHLVPFVFNFIEFCPLYFSSTDYKLAYFAILKAKGSVVMPIHYLLKTLSFFIYLVAQLLLFRKFIITQKKEEVRDKHLISWLIIYFGSQIVLIVGSLSDHLTGLHIFHDPYNFAVNMATIFLYSIMIALLFFPRFLYNIEVVKKESKDKYGYSKLQNDEKNSILNQLNHYMQKEDKPYLDEKISLTSVAIKLNVSPQQLSQVINEKTAMNFNDFINQYRTEEAKVILVSSYISRLTIDAIAQKAGFHSKSAFYTAFKKHTNMTPKEYIAKKNRKSVSRKTI